MVITSLNKRLQRGQRRRGDDESARLTAMVCGGGPGNGNGSAGRQEHHEKTALEAPWPDQVNDPPARGRKRGWVCTQKAAPRPITRSKTFGRIFDQLQHASPHTNGWGRKANTPHPHLNGWPTGRREAEDFWWRPPSLPCRVRGTAAPSTRHAFGGPGDWRGGEREAGFELASGWGFRGAASPGARRTECSFLFPFVSSF